MNISFDQHRCNAPAMEQIAAAVGSSLWQRACVFLQSKYGSTPAIQYSGCSAAPGWNVKYRKAGRALCTLYPDEGFFTALICIGPKEEAAAQLLLPLCTAKTQQIYRTASGMASTRWVMLPVDDEAQLQDFEALVALRVKPAPQKEG